MSQSGGPRGHAFISYVGEDSAHVDQLQQVLQEAGIPVWRDTAEIQPGQDRLARIREAITGDALVFLACFSQASVSRATSRQNSELRLAVEEFSRHRPGDPWLIPVRFDDCRIPDIAIGGNQTLASIQHADLFGDRRDENARRLAQSILRTLGSGVPSAGSTPVPVWPVEAGLAGRVGAAPGHVWLADRDVLVKIPVAPTPMALPAALAHGFTGRDAELAAVLAALDPKSGTPTSAIVGTAGIGKTELAKQAGHTAQGRGWFGGGVLFDDLNGYDAMPKRPERVLVSFLRALGAPPDDIPPALDDRVALYRSTLAAIAEPVLVVIDNARDIGQVRPLLPGVQRHRVLVTSRHTLPLEARLFELQALAERQAVELLDGALRSRDPADDRIAARHEDAAQVALACGLLPLALQIAAALLVARPGLSTARLAEALADRRSRLDMLDDTERAVRASFALSYQHLDLRHARLFRLLTANPGPDVSTGAAAALAGLDQPDAEAVLDELARAHLIAVAPGRDRWRMHDLLREYAEELADQEAEADGRERARDRLLDHYVETTQAAAARLLAADPSARGERSASRQSLDWFEAERANLTAAADLANETGRDGAAVLLAMHLSEFCAVQRYLDDQLAMAQIGLEAARRRGEATEEGAALATLGHALAATPGRRAEAVAAFNEAVAILRDSDDDEATVWTCVALQGIGHAMAADHQLEQAVAALQDAVAKAQAAGRTDLEAMSLTTLGATLQQAKPDEAGAALERAIAATRGEGGFSQATALAGLGRALTDAKRFDEAVAAFDRAVGIFRELGMRAFEAIARDGLADALAAAGRAKDAIAARRAAVTVFHQAGDAGLEASALRDLGATLRDAGRPKDAVAAYEQALELFRQARDRDGEATTLRYLGFALAGLRRFGDAADAHRQAAEISRGIADRGGLARAASGLGFALRKSDRPREAVAAHLEAMAAFRGLGDYLAADKAVESLGLALKELASVPAADLVPPGADQHATAEALDDLGRALLGLRRHADALSACERAAQTFRDVADSAGEAMALSHAALAMAGLGRPDEAVSAHHRAVAASRQADDRRRIGICLGNLGSTLTALRRFDEAETAYLQAHAAVAEIDDNELAGWMLDGLGDALLGMGRADAAAAAYAQAVETLRHTADHLGHAGALADLGGALYRLRRYGEAADAFAKARPLLERSGLDWRAGLVNGFRLNARARQRLSRRSGARERGGPADRPEA